LETYEPTTRAYSHRPVAENAECLPIPEVLRRIPISRAKLYGLIRDGALTTKHVGTRVFVLASSLDSYIGSDKEDAD
jgi:hypothetical protein